MSDELRDEMQEAFEKAASPQPDGSWITEETGALGWFNTGYMAALVEAERRVAEVTKGCRAELAAVRVREGQANYLLARVVAAANVGAIDGEDGFIERYDMPVGPIHKAIPFLSEVGIVVTLDGRIMNSPTTTTTTTTTAALATGREEENK